MECVNVKKEHITSHIINHHVFLHTENWGGTNWCKNWLKQMQKIILPHVYCIILIISYLWYLLSIIQQLHYIHHPIYFLGGFFTFPIYPFSYQRCSSTPNWLYVKQHLVRSFHSYYFCWSLNLWKIKIKLRFHWYFLISSLNFAIWKMEATFICF
jgi:hypothetical protein